MADYALVKDGQVVNVIVVDDVGFLDVIRDDYDHIEPVDEHDPRPGMGWAYDGATFTAPPPPPDPEPEPEPDPGGP